MRRFPSLPRGQTSFRRAVRSAAKYLFSFLLSAGDKEHPPVIPRRAPSGLFIQPSENVIPRAALSCPEQRAIAQTQGVHFTPDNARSVTAPPVWIKAKVTVAPNITVRGDPPAEEVDKEYGGKGVLQFFPSFSTEYVAARFVRWLLGRASRAGLVFYLVFLWLFFVSLALFFVLATLR